MTEPVELNECQVCARRLRSVQWRLDPYRSRMAFICAGCLGVSRSKSNLKRAVKAAKKRVQ